jgi:hypothetical protein
MSPNSIEVLRAYSIFMYRKQKIYFESKKLAIVFLEKTFRFAELRTEVFMIKALLILFLAQPPNAI